MKLIVNPHKIEIDTSEAVNEKEINISQCEFNFTDEITNEFVKEAYFTFKGESYKQIIVNNKCDFPQEVLVEKGQVEIGVVAYLVEDETEIVRYNPSPVYFETWLGSLKANAENSEPITPSEMEQYEQALQDGLNDIAEAVASANNLDIDAEKVGDTATITITRQDETQKSVQIKDGKDGVDGKDGKDGINGIDGADGVGLNYNWSGTSLGVKREDEQNYSYVNLKGDQGPVGPAGAIKMQIVNSLPASGDGDTIYLVPFQGETGNIYEEYIYVNGAWEKIGGSVSIDLTDYVKNNSWASNSKGGVFKTSNTNYGTYVDPNNGVMSCETKNYTNYSSASGNLFISKGTLENVLAEKIGNINTILATLTTPEEE